MLDLKHFKKVSSDKTHTVLSHPDGHEIRIVHGKVDPEIRSELKHLPSHKMAKGGEVPPSDKKEEPKPFTPEQQATAQSIASGFKKATGYAGGTPDGIPEVDPLALEQINQGRPFPSIEQVSDRLPSLSTTASAPPLSQLQSAAPPISEPLSNIPAQTIEQPQPQTANFAAPLDAAIQSYKAGLGQATTGLQQEAQAAGEQATAQAMQARQGAEELQHVIDNSQKHSLDLAQESKHLMDDIKAQHIDPNHYMGSKDTLGKISTIAGLLIGGLGGPGNAASKFFDDQIARDIDAQKANLGKSENLLSANLRLFGNMNDASKMTAAMLMDHTSLKLQQAAMATQDPIAQARAQQKAGEMQMQASQVFQELGMKKSMMEALSNSKNPAQTIATMRIVNPQMAAEMEKRFVPGIGMAQVPVEPKVRDEIATRSDLDKKLTELEKFSKEHSGSLSPEVMRTGKTLAQDAQDAYRRANGQGVFREAEAKFVNNMVSDDPTAFFAKYRSLPGYKAVQRGNRSALGAQLDVHGLPKPSWMSFKAR